MRARLTRVSTSTVFNWWWLHQSDGSELPIPQTQLEVIHRIGLDYAVRKLGKFGGPKFMAVARADFANRAAAESALAALIVAADAFEPLRFEFQRPDLSWLNYDSLNVRFLILPEVGSPGVTFRGRHVGKVVGGFSGSSNYIADFGFTFLPVLLS